MSPADGHWTRAVYPWTAAGLVGLLLAFLPVVTTLPAGGEQAGEEATEEPKNPYRGQQEAIEEGERIYRGRCYGCHFRAGGRGPNIFQTRLTDAQFVDAVTNGRKNGMPAWGSVLSTEEIWQVHAFVLSRDRL